MRINNDFEEYFLTHSNYETAIKFNICKTTVWKWARKLRIKRKTNKYKNVNCNLTNEQQDILIGSLLGDGSLTKIFGKTKLSAYTEGHCLAQENYLRWKYEQLKPFSIAFYKEIRNTTIKGFNYKTSKYMYSNSSHEVFVMRTIHHPIFRDLEKKWYLYDENGNYIFDSCGKRIKIIPHDIVITPLSLAVWFFDDGYRNELDGQVCFSTMCFTFKECKFLVDKIKSLGISNCWVRNRGSKPEIVIGYSSYLYFIDIIKPFLPDQCMKYKLDLCNMKQTKFRYTMSENIAKEIINLYRLGFKQFEIADKVNLSRSQINRFILGKTWQEYQLLW